VKNGRFHPSKCRGKVQKKGVLYTHSPKCQAHLQTTETNFFLNQKKEGKRGPAAACVRLWAVANG
jgi:hypothetical protein